MLYERTDIFNGAVIMCPACAGSGYFLAQDGPIENNLSKRTCSDCNGARLVKIQIKRIHRSEKNEN